MNYRLLVLFRKFYLENFVADIDKLRVIISALIQVGNKGNQSPRVAPRLILTYAESIAQDILCTKKAEGQRFIEKSHNVGILVYWELVGMPTTLEETSGRNLSNRLVANRAYALEGLITPVA